VLYGSVIPVQELIHLAPSDAPDGELPPLRRLKTARRDDVHFEAGKGPRFAGSGVCLPTSPPSAVASGLAPNVPDLFALQAPDASQSADGRAAQPHPVDSDLIPGAVGYDKMADDSLPQILTAASSIVGISPTIDSTRVAT